MVRQFLRVAKMDENRLTKKVILWDKKVSDYFPFPTWYQEVKTIFATHNLMAHFEQGGDVSHVISNLKQSMLVKQNVELKAKCESKPKLRTFVTFKEFGTTPDYLKMPISFVQKKFLAKTRLSALAIRIETGRYERPKLQVNERLCPSCKDGHSIENEDHFIFSCSKYNILRQLWLIKLTKPENFVNMNCFEKFKVIFDQSANVKITAQYIIDCYDVRSKLI